MKLLLLTLLFTTAGLAAEQPRYEKCGKYKGRQLYKGEKGGCFYLKGKKKAHVYLDRKHCKC